MIVTHKINMDMDNPQLLPVVDMVQDDKFSRMVEITLLENGKPWIPMEDSRVLIRYAKSDGTGGEYDTMPEGAIAWSLTENVLILWLAPQMLTVAGPVRMNVGFLNGIGEINSFPILLHVHPNVRREIAGSEDYFNITEFLTRDGWIPDMYLGTDAQGRVVEVPVPVQEVDATLTREGIAADAKATGDALKALPIGQGEDGYTWISGLRRASAIGLTREEGGITVTTTLEGGMTEVSRLVLDEGGYPVAIETDGAICGLTWAGFAEAELQIWEGGSY